MNKEDLTQFIEWLPVNINDFKDKTPDEVVTILNKLAQTEEGLNEISGLISQFKQKQMFKFGGKLGQLINKFQQGGKSDQRKSDKVRKNFHGVSLFEYGPNKYKTARGTLVRDLKPGVHQETLPNGIGLRQITRNNTTTSELVSPDKRDTLYINNADAGRIDSNINDAGILGKLGLRTPTPVSSNFRRLQGIFNAEKFNTGGEVTKDGYMSSSVTNPDGSIKQTLRYPSGKEEYRTISRDKQDTTYTNSVNGITRRNNPKWYHFVDKEANKKGYAERQRRFNEHYKE